MDDANSSGSKIRRILDEGPGVDVPQGDHYDRLRAVIAEELQVQLEVLASDVKLAEDVIADIADWIAIEVDWQFTLSPRIFPPRTDA